MKIQKEELGILANLYKNFSDTSRLSILNFLINNKACVYDISEAVNMSQSAVSHQLQYLRQTNFVKAERKGREIYYELSDDHIEKIIRLGLEHIREDKYGN